MEKKDEKFGFVRHDPYDVSQRSLSLANKADGRGRRDSKSSASSSSYSSEPPSASVVKRIKMR